MRHERRIISSSTRHFCINRKDTRATHFILQLSDHYCYDFGSSASLPLPAASARVCNDGAGLEGVQPPVAPELLRAALPDLRGYGATVSELDGSLQLGRPPHGALLDWNRSAGPPHMVLDREASRPAFLRSEYIMTVPFLPPQTTSN